MSSIAFSTDLLPDPRLRRIVLGSAIGLFALGLVIVATMSIAIPFRVALGSGWLLLAMRQLRILACHHARTGRIRIYADGSAEVAAAAGAWHAATLAPGSIVLDRIAWLRLECVDGTSGAELLTGNSRRNEEWRRLQMIWRHLGKPD